jgi:hypothetical protein
MCVLLVAMVGKLRGHCILFSVVYTPPPPSRHGSVWLLPVYSLN